MKSLVPEIKSMIFCSMFHLVEQAVMIAVFTGLYGCRALGFCTEFVEMSGPRTETLNSGTSMLIFFVCFG